MPHPAYRDPLYRLSDYAVDGFLVTEIRDLHAVEFARRAAVDTVYYNRGC